MAFASIRPSAISLAMFHSTSRILRRAGFLCSFVRQLKMTRLRLDIVLVRSSQVCRCVGVKLKTLPALYLLTTHFHPLVQPMCSSTRTHFFDGRRDWRSWFMPRFVGVIVVMSSGIAPCTTPVSYLPFFHLRITLIDITPSSTPVMPKTTRHTMGVLKGRLHIMLWTLEYLDLKCSSFT